MVNHPDPIAPLQSEQKILQAARKVFLQKGMDGARMQEIADEAGVNKALIHYYFRSKESLFSAVFQSAVRELLPEIVSVFGSDKPLMEKIPDFVRIHMSFVQANPLLPKFIIMEVHRNPLMIINGFAMIKEEGMFDKFRTEVQKSIEKGEIRPVDPVQLIINILSLSVFPFIANPILMGFLGINQDEYDLMIERRKTEVGRFIVNSLKP